MLLALLLAPAAHAAQALLLPGAPLVAGEPGTVELWVPDLPPGARVVAHAPQARVGQVKRLDDGRLLVPFTPAATAAGDLPLELRLSGPAGKEQQTVAVPVTRATTGGLSLQASVEELILGDRGPVQVDSQAAGSSPQPLAERHLLVQPSLGRLDAPAPSETGWTVHWTPPTSLPGPAWALLAVADASAPGAVPGWLALPLTVPTPVSFDVSPGTRCQLLAGPHLVGPKVADSQGHIAFTVPLHPSVARGTLSCVLGTRAFDRAVGLPAGRDPWIGWLPLPERVPAGATIPVQAVVVESDGNPRAAGTAPRLSATSGAASSLQIVGPGLARGTWTAPLEPGPVELRLDLLGQQARITVQVVPDLPVVSVALDPAVLAAGERDAHLVISGATPVAVQIEGGALRGRIASGEGGATATARLDRAAAFATATVQPKLSTSALVPACVLAWADTPTLPAGSRQDVGVTLAAVDALGLPVPGVLLALQAEGGTAADSVRTDGQGLARVRLRPSADGLAVLRARTAGLEGDATVLVGLAPGPLSTAPGSGSDRERLLRERLRAAVPTLVLAPAGTVAGQTAAPAVHSPLPSPASASAQAARDAAGPALARQAVIEGHPPKVRTPPEERGPAWAQLIASVAMVPHAYTETSTGLYGLPARVRADQGNLFAARPAGAPGLDVRVLLSPPSWPVSADLRMAGRYEGYVVNERAFTRVDLQGAAGVRMPFARASRLQPYALGQAEYFRVPIFSYDSFRAENPDKATGARMKTGGVLGARLGAGAELRHGRLGLQGEASETLSPWPVNTRGQLSATFDLGATVSLRAAAELSFRTMTFDLTADRAHIFDQQHALSLGLVVRLR